MSGRFIKVVIVGSSGVGKTSLRHQYISGHFATGYRATIGTDFITKTLPHYSQLQVAKSPTVPIAPSDDDLQVSTVPTATPVPITTSPDPVTLQIWDTAGQERFSSLSTAFFRGADAVILVFDVNKPDTLADLQRWWDEFRIRVPIPEGEEANYCVVVVGNKSDLAPSTSRSRKEVVNRRAAESFLAKMVPTPADETSHEPASPSEEAVTPIQPNLTPNSTLLPDSETATVTQRTSSLTATRPLAFELSRDSNPLSASQATIDSAATPRAEVPPKSPTSKYGTMTTTKTGLSIYHTPSSSLFDSASRFLTPDEGPSSASRSRTRSSGSNRRKKNDRRSDEDFEMSMDLEYDYDYDLRTSSSSVSAYASAKSTPSQSPERRSKSRPRQDSMASEASLSTVRPTVVPFPTNVTQQSGVQFTESPSSSPTRSRASTTSSSSSVTKTHNIANMDLPTPSASPPSPPLLTASLMATLHQNPPPATNSQKLDVGPKLFLTSAKTGGTLGPSTAILGLQNTPIAEIFAYIAERVVKRWEWEERTLEFQNPEEADGSRGPKRAAGTSLTIRLGEKWKGLVGGRSCCAI
ncbi:hypothetical protein FRB99_003506 [Tulasnella sp. 403]|nr:hypothetical protein FRB99_003506 [Tulasnella sp. 403]